jgi:hypothetical protein
LGAPAIRFPRVAAFKENGHAQDHIESHRDRIRL